MDHLENVEGAGDAVEDAGHSVILCSVGKEHFAIPLEDIAEIHKSEEITPLPTTPVFLAGVINVHGHLYSVVSLARALDIEDAEDGDLLILLVHEKGGFAVRVDATTGFDNYNVLEEVTRDASEAGGRMPFLEGVFRSGERLVSLINPDKLRIWIDGEFAKGDD